MVPAHPLAWVPGILFSGIGMTIVGLLTVGICSRQVIRERATELSFEWKMFGRSLRTRRWPKQEIEQIVRIAIPGRVPAHEPLVADDERLGPQAYEVIVRRGDDLVRLARGADEQTQRWLCRTLQQLVSR